MATQIVVLGPAQKNESVLVAVCALLTVVAVIFCPIALMAYAVWAFRTERKRLEPSFGEFLWPFFVGLAVTISTATAWWFWTVWPTWKLVVAGAPYAVLFVSSAVLAIIVIVAITSADDCD